MVLALGLACARSGWQESLNGSADPALSTGSAVDASDRIGRWQRQDSRAIYGSGIV